MEIYCLEIGLYDVKIEGRDNFEFNFTYDVFQGEKNNVETLEAALLELAQKHKDDTYNPVELLRLSTVHEFTTESLRNATH